MSDLQNDIPRSLPRYHPDPLKLLCIATQVYAYGRYSQAYRCHVFSNSVTYMNNTIYTYISIQLGIIIMQVATYVDMYIDQVCVIAD